MTDCFRCSALNSVMTEQIGFDIYYHCDKCLIEWTEREYYLEQQNAKLVEMLEELRERFRDIEINYNCIDVVNISMDSQIKIDEILAEVKGE